MCRALWLLVVGSSEEACRTLRRAAGVDAQVVGIATAAGEALDLAAKTSADVIVLDGRLAGAASLVEDLRARAPDAALLWIGDPPEIGADAVLAWGPALPDEMPGAVTRALLARRKPG